MGESMSRACPDVVVDLLLHVLGGSGVDRSGMIRAFPKDPVDGDVEEISVFDKHIIGWIVRSALVSPDGVLAYADFLGK